MTDEAIKELKKNYDRVEQLTREFSSDATKPRGVIVMGSGADKPIGEKIATHLRAFGIEPILRVCSAHKSTAEALQLVGDYESECSRASFLMLAACRRLHADRLHRDRRALQRTGARHCGQYCPSRLWVSDWTEV